MSDKKYRWLHKLLKVRGIQLQFEMIVCNKYRIMMHEENKRRRRNKPHTKLDNINDDNETRSEPETTNYLSLFSDFLVSDDIIGSGIDLDYCAMCMKTGNAMRSLSVSERMTLLCDHRLYVSPTAHRCITICCEKPCQRFQEPTRLIFHQVQRLISDLVLELSSTKCTFFVSEHDRNCSDDDYLSWTSWTLDQLKSMALLIAPRMRTSKHRSLFEAVCVFWTKLKTNLSFRQIGMLFKFGTQEARIRRRVDDTFHAVLVNLKEILVPKYLGLSHLRRLEALNYHTTHSREFFGDHLCLIWDSRYIYCNKSNDRPLERSSYSGQKFRHLIKMMSLVLPDGYILDLLSPFYGKHNDASISKAILLCYWVCPSESRFLIVKSPCFIKCDGISFFILKNTFDGIFLPKTFFTRKDWLCLGV